MSMHVTNSCHLCFCQSKTLISNIFQGADEILNEAPSAVQTNVLNQSVKFKKESWNDKVWNFGAQTLPQMTKFQWGNKFYYIDTMETNVKNQFSTIICYNSRNTLVFYNIRICPKFYLILTLGNRHEWDWKSRQSLFWSWYQKLFKKYPNQEILLSVWSKFLCTGWNVQD